MLSEVFNNFFSKGIYYLLIIYCIFYVLNLKLKLLNDDITFFIFLFFLIGIFVSIIKLLKIKYYEKN